MSVYPVNLTTSSKFPKTIFANFIFHFQPSLSVIWLQRLSKQQFPTDWFCWRQVFCEPRSCGFGKTKLRWSGDVNFQARSLVNFSDQALSHIEIPTATHDIEYQCRSTISTWAAKFKCLLVLQVCSQGTILLLDLWIYEQYSSNLERVSVIVPFVHRIFSHSSGWRRLLGPAVPY